jgi:hypothetical protein
MMQRGFRVVAVAALTALLPMGAAFGADEGTNIQVERPVPAPPEPDAGYRPPWADPNAKPSQPGIENDPTPFDPSNVDGNSDTLNINNLDQ